MFGYFIGLQGRGISYDRLFGFVATRLIRSRPLNGIFMLHGISALYLECGRWCVVVVLCSASAVIVNTYCKTVCAWFRSFPATCTIWKRSLVACACCFRAPENYLPATTCSKHCSRQFKNAVRASLKVSSLFLVWRKPHLGMLRPKNKIAGSKRVGMLTTASGACDAADENSCTWRQGLGLRNE